MRIPVCISALFLASFADVSASAAATLDAAEADVRSGRPFVVSVVVPLCDNTQINCGSGIAGRPRGLAHNLYWGAIFGARRFFDRPNSGYERVEITQSDEVLERVVYRRWIAGSRWGVGPDVEQLVVLQAIDGARIDDAVKRFWSLATEGGTLKLDDGGRVREERIHIAGYAGHNRLMDGKTLPPMPDLFAPLPSFVLACYSEEYFGASLRAAGSAPVVTTKALMAPEGYVIEATVRALGDHEDDRGVRAAVTAAYAKWQRLPMGTATGMFAR